MKQTRLKGIRLSKKVLLFAVAVGLLICLAVGLYVWNQSNSSVQKSDESSNPADESTYTYPAPAADEEAANKITDEYAAGAVSATDAQSRLSAAESAASNPGSKQVYSLAAIGVLSEAGQFDQALALALKADAAYKSVDTAATVAGMYDALSQFDNAAKYYQLAADRSEKPTDSTQRSSYNDYINSKREAEAKL